MQRQGGRLCRPLSAQYSVVHGWESQLRAAACALVRRSHWRPCDACWVATSTSVTTMSMPMLPGVRWYASKARSKGTSSNRGSRASSSQTGRKSEPRRRQPFNVPTLSYEELESGDGAVNPKSLCNLIRERPERFLQQEGLQQLSAAVPRIAGGNQHSYTSLIVEFAKRNLMHEAVQLLMKVDAECGHINVASFNAMLSGYARLGNTEGISVTLEIMRSSRIKPDIITHTILMRMYAKRGDVDSCKRIMDDMAKQHLQPDEYTMGTLVEGFFTAGKYENAMRVVELMRSTFGVPPTINTYNILIGQLAKANRYSDAIRVYEEIEKNLHSGIRPNLSTYAILMRASLHQSQPAKAVALFYSCSRANLQPTVTHYTMLLRAYALLGHFESALELLDDMTKRKVDVDDWLYFSFAREFLLQNRVAELLTVCARMDELGVRMNQNVGARIKNYFDALAKEESIPADVGDLIKLARTLHKHKINYRTNNIYEPFLEKYKQAKRPVDAVQLMEQVHAAGGKVHRSFYYSIASLCASLGDLQTSSRLHKLHDAQAFRR